MPVKYSGQRRVLAGIAGVALSMVRSPFAVYELIYAPDAPLCPADRDAAALAARTSAAVSMRSVRAPKYISFQPLISPKRTSSLVKPPSGPAAQRTLCAELVPGMSLSIAAVW